MPYWFVQEPQLSLWIEDQPLGYTPALGPEVSFQVTYNQLRASGNDIRRFGTGYRWTCSWFSHVTPGQYSSDTVVVPCGGAKSMTSGYGDYHLTWMLTRPPTTYDPYFVDRPDGSRDTYGFHVTNTVGTVLEIYRTQHTDPHGQSLTFSYAGYDPADPVVRLLTVIDAEGRTNRLYYATNHPLNTNLITAVVDPFGRTTTLAYDNNGLLTNIVDVAGITSSFTYDGSQYLTNLTTPYGPTTFATTPGESGTSPHTRSVTVTEPNGGRHLYLYWDSAAGVPTSYPDEPNTTPFSDTFDNSSMNVRNTFYWSPLQYAALSTTNHGSLTTNDFAKARLRHWLSQGGSLPGGTLSLERLPSPDGTTAGQKIWYDYADKINSYEEGTSIMPLFEALVLPDGTTRFTRTERNTWNQPTIEVSTYSKTDGSIGLRTNTYTYAANGIDLTLLVGYSGEQVVSNWFNNSYHQPDASYNALNEETKFTYNANRQVTSIKRPSGLTTTNVYFTTGDYTGWLDKTIDLEINRTNAYTYANGLVQTHTDERNLTTTHYWDALQRLTGVSYPDSTTISNRYTALDVTSTKDRLGFWSYFGYNSIRRRTAETNANGVVTLYSYCSCGSLDSMTAGYGTAQAETTSYFYDLQGRRTLTLLPDGTGITNGWDAVGQLEWSDDGTGTRSFFYNNNQGMVTNIATWHGDLQRTTYDIEDRPLWVTDANGVTTTNAYDDLGRLTRRSWNGGAETNNYRLNTGGPTNMVNALGKTNWFVYDAAGRKTFETNANNEVISYTYNSAGDLLTLKDGKAQTTTWIYDPYGRVTNKLDQSSQEVFRYK